LFAPALRQGHSAAEIGLRLLVKTMRSEPMTILVAYVARPEGQAALDKGIEIAKRRNERLVVVNASPGGTKEDEAMIDVQESERVEKLLRTAGIDAEFKQFVRGKSAVEEINALVESLQASVLIIGLRKRSPVGKLIMGSVAQELLLTVSCPVLAVKAK
jgi:nucleotide-binding universal stress UspA family protein